MATSLVAALALALACAAAFASLDASDISGGRIVNLNARAERRGARTGAGSRIRQPARPPVRGARSCSGS